MSLVRPDPLGVSRWTDACATGTAWPATPWLPIQISARDGDVVVDWADFGTRPLTESFFEDSIRRALRASSARYRMSLRDLIAQADSARSLKPSGFIFHMSRCGSTLAAQMLAAPPENIVISEAAPIDAAVQLGAEALAAMISAYGRPRTGERNLFIKLDSWHALALPLFRRAFPDVPWVFLYRDPIEVLVSQMRQRGTQTVPEFVPPSLYGIETFEGMSSEDYCARVLSAICRAALEHYGEGGGLLVNYRELPEALFTKILPHFGVTIGDDERELMRGAAQRDAKSPATPFTGDSEAKQSEATAAVRAAADEHLGAVYRALEALRADATR